MDAFLGEIRAVSFNYAPEGWMLCQGQILNVSQYQGLFALIGDTYGGDGESTFALPDLRNRVPTQYGQTVVATTTFAQSGGTSDTQLSTEACFTLTDDNMPQHSHAARFTPIGGGPAVQPTITVKVSADTASQASAPDDGYLATAKPASIGQAPFIYSTSASSMTTLNSLTAEATGGSGGGITGGVVSIGPAGNANPSSVSAPVSVTMPAVMPPFLAMNYIICVSAGVWPPKP